MTGGDLDIFLTGTSVLKVTGAKTITGTIDGVSSASGTLDIDAATTVSGVVGGGIALTAIDVADGIVYTQVGNVSATTITLGSSAGTASELKLTAATTVTGNIAAVAANKGVLNIDHNVTVAGTIGATNGINEIDVAAGKVLIVFDEVFETLNIFIYKNI